MNNLSTELASLQLFVFGGILLVFWTLELFTSTQKSSSKILHGVLNAKFIILVVPVQVLLSLAVFFVARWTETSAHGLLYLLPHSINSIVLFIVAFVMLDFFDYLYHYMMHNTPLFWRFHQVHHSDMDVDISTTLREHPGETFIRVSFSILAIAIVGASPWVLVVKQFIQSFSNLLSHSKLRLPKKVDDVVSLLFVTSSTHRAHHHFQLPHTDSNYGDVLTIWDRLFSTLSTLTRSEVICGLDTHMNLKHNMDFKNLILRPFKPLSSIADGCAHDLPLLRAKKLIPGPAQ